MVPADSRRVSRVPRYLGATGKEKCLFQYGAVTLFGPAFQPCSRNALFSLVRQCRNRLASDLLAKSRSESGCGIACGPATPCSRCQSHGLGCSEFARHYYRNHGCFLFLQVLRWFTSLGSLQPAMNSPEGTRGSLSWVSPFGHPRIKDC